jgi:peroxiredoxin (alkyl hydroperoxide reductase subunit C)
MEDDTCIRFPVLGEPAPDFEAETTYGPITLSSLKGKWVVFFSHPADFTPVCTTEFMAVAQIYRIIIRRLLSPPNQNHF